MLSDDEGMREAPEEPQEELHAPQPIKLSARQNQHSEIHDRPIEQRTRAALSALADAGYSVTPDDLAKLIPAHPYEAEIAVVAEVRGYFQVSYK